MSRILTEKQMEQVKKIWRLYDKDDNGFLDKEELRNVINDLNAFMFFTEKEIEDLIIITNKNGDGKIDINEFAQTFC
jgi:Ca2+-binding EF-hand superfamily protein